MNTRDRYNYISMPEHPKAYFDGTVLEHRIVMEKYLGRLLDRFECVHHINGDGKDNNIENLEVMSLQEHTSLHKLKYPKGNLIDQVCTWCKTEFKRNIHNISRTENTFCSKECFRLYRVSNRV